MFLKLFGMNEATLMRGPPDGGFVSDFLTVKPGFGCDIIGHGKGSDGTV